MTSGPREDLGYVPATNPEPPAKPPLPGLTVDQLRTLRRVSKRSALDRKMWTLLAMSELARMRLIAPNNELNQFWVLTPLGVEVLERTKGRQV